MMPTKALNKTEAIHRAQTDLMEIHLMDSQDTMTTNTGQIATTNLHNGRTIVPSTLTDQKPSHMIKADIPLKDTTIDQTHTTEKSMTTEKGSKHDLAPTIATNTTQGIDLRQTIDIGIIPGIGIEGNTVNPTINLARTITDRHRSLDKKMIRAMQSMF